MFRFTRKPSSGSHSQCLAKITIIGSVLLISDFRRDLNRIRPDGLILSSAWNSLLHTLKEKRDKHTTHKNPTVQASQVKVLTGVGDLREVQVDVPLSVSHSRV